MRQYILRRLLLLLPTILGVTLLVAALVRLLPGTVVDTIVAEAGGQIDRTEVARRLGLDRSFPEFYLDWVSGVLRGDFGQRFRGGGDVLDDVADRIPVTLELGSFAILVALLIAVPVGVVAAVRQDSPVDYLARSFAISVIALPTFWLGTLAVVFIPKLFGKSLPVFYHHFWDDPVENLKQMWLPAVILGGAISGSIMRLVRSQMLEVLRQDYIRTAWAKGLRERVVVVRHALRNALIPIVTIIGLQVPVLVGGSVVMESIFVLPGMGRLLMEALLMRDYPVVLAINLLVAAFIVAANLVVDVTYGYLDPRVRMA